MYVFSTDHPFAFLVDILTHLLVLLFMLRLLFQLTRADIHNPISQTVLKFSDPALRPMRRIIPSIGRLDTASAVAMLLAQILGLLLIAAINGTVLNPLLLILPSLLLLIQALLQLYFVTLLAEALLSWLNPNPYSPAMNILQSLNAPLLDPVRKRLPATGGVDFSVMIVMIAILFLMRIVG